MIFSLRRTVLHLRCRAIPATALVFLAAAAVTWSSYASDDPGTTRTIGQTAIVLGMAATARTLAGPDEDLERSTAAPWKLIRTVHVTALGGTLLALLTAAHRFGAGPGGVAVPEGMLVQAVFGLLALSALGAAVLGAARAWSLPVGWGLTALTVGPKGTPSGEALTWMVQDPGTTISITVAAVVTVVGVGDYIRRGSHR
ncbi:hypothetical protein [Streptomyces sp. NEAU-S77]|uniref:hypothetical protein n=1 Tax=Streptomyces sp. NEAU-S77 TaxID=3411033 RepID=UPI003BA19AAE